MSKSPLPPKRRKAREALPAIYVVVNGAGALLCGTVSTTPHDTANFLADPGDRIQKYLPAPTRRAR